MEIYTMLLIFIAAIAFLVIIAYNGLISLKNQVKNAWAQIDVQLKRRNDLIPNLVEAVKGYMKYEKSALKEITKARAGIMNARSVEGKAKASSQLTDALKSFFAVAENYPKLKASNNFMHLQEEISGTENKIAYSRQYYNDVVMAYNTRIQVFPQSIIANIFKFKKMDSFLASESERKNVEIRL
ncbi:MAG: LemA family protein [Candidatus Nanoarchaeia archaeon]|nr:LemA family protein [Candidatus Nanoarchaeia archaeon]MDD5054331.1 LemA family protein [Candidatus Nanoarchaeia archaeon]MDD5499332.1 LemA family protein [Candidatus Nanoarchaeia archaeon]